MEMTYHNRNIFLDSMIKPGHPSQQSAEEHTFTMSQASFSHALIWTNARCTHQNEYCQERNERRCEQLYHNCDNLNHTTHLAPLQKKRSGCWGNAQAKAEGTPELWRYYSSETHRNFIPKNYKILVPQHAPKVNRFVPFNTLCAKSKVPHTFPAGMLMECLNVYACSTIVPYHHKFYYSSAQTPR